MSLFDNLKNRQQLKKETANAEQIKNGMYASWNNLIQEYNTRLAPGGQPFEHSENGDVQWQHILQNYNGQSYSVGAVKITSTPNQEPLYEFLLVYPQQDGQTASQYYSMSAMGNFSNDRGLATFNIGYISQINGTEVPCSAQIPVSTQDLLNLNNTSLTPRVTPAISSINPSACMPNINEIYTIIGEFCRVNNINQNIQHNETTSDFMPGR